MATTVSQDTAASNPFFSDVKSILGSFQQGLEFTGKEIVPRWFSQQLLNQQFDQLQQPTFVPTFAPPTNGGAQNTGTTPQPAGFLFDNFSVSAGGILIAAAAVIGVILVARS